jgi:hypothetical protein
MAMSVLQIRRYESRPFNVFVLGAFVTAAKKNDDLVVA